MTLFATGRGTCTCRRCLDAVARDVAHVQQRLEFVCEYETELFTMTELAAQYGISRKTGYKWLARYEAEGADGLRDHSRRPHQSPHATDPDLVAG